LIVVVIVVIVSVVVIIVAVWLKVLARKRAVGGGAWSERVEKPCNLARHVARPPRAPRCWGMEVGLRRG